MAQKNTSISLEEGLLTRIQKFVGWVKCKAIDFPAIADIEKAIKIGLDHKLLIKPMLSIDTPRTVSGVVEQCLLGYCTLDALDAWMADQVAREAYYLSKFGGVNVAVKPTRKKVDAPTPMPVNLSTVDLPFIPASSKDDPSASAGASAKTSPKARTSAKAEPTKATKREVKQPKKTKGSK